MRKGLLLSLALLFAATMAFAQDRTVSGKVTSAEDGSPIPGVNIVVKGTTTGAVTDIDGNYKLSVPADGGILVFSFIGLQTQEIEIGNRSTIDLSMASDAEQLSEVVVTAMGIEKQRDQLGYTSTTVGGESLVNSGETGIMNSMKGKIAGVNIVQNGGDPGAGSRITIRGATSITGSLQPLIVIDGVPMYNTTGNASTAGVTGQSRLNDLNPDDIESMEVLKGASAAALWGSRAANGVIMITTKKGSSGTRPYTINFSSRVTFDQINKKIPLQTEYGQGWDGQYYGGFYVGWASGSWGDRIADRKGGADDFITDPNDPGYAGYFVSDITGKTYYAVAGGDYAGNPHGGKNDKTVYDPYDALFKTGVTYTNSISVGANNENGSIFASFANLTQDGIIMENSNYVRNNARLNVTRYLGDKITATANLSYTRSTSDRVNKGSNLSGLLLGGLRNAADFDQSDYRGTYFDVNGVPYYNRQRAYRNPLGMRDNSTYDNARWNMENVTDNSTVDRMIGKFELGYDPTDWLNFTGRIGYDSYTDGQESYWHHLSASYNGGRYEKYTERRTQFQGDLMAMAHHTFSDAFKGNILIGASVNDRRLDWQFASVTGFTNLSSPPNLANGPADAKATEGGKSWQRNYGYYGTLGFEIFEQVFVNVSGRLDAYSTFSEDDNTFFYPAADIAWQFTKILPKSDIFTFGKIRANWGQVGRAPGTYVTTTNFVSGGYGDGWVPGLDAANYGGGFRRSSRAGNPGIRPEIKTEIEVGTDLRFWKDRISFGFTYYVNNTTDLIISIDVPVSSGFSSRVDNAAEIENKGIEMELGASIIETNDFRWDLSANYASNKNEVISLAGVDNIYLTGFTSAGSYAVVGEPLGVIFGARWARDEQTGEQLLDAAGFPYEAATPGVIGDPNPDFTIGFTNTFTYKKFRLNVLFETVQGGQVWNGTRGALSYFGRYGDQGVTTVLTDAQATSLAVWPGGTVADWHPEYDNGDGTWTVRGKIADFGAGEVFLDEYWYDWGPGSGFTGPSEQFVEDASWWRLREVSLGYDFSSMFNDGLFSNFSLTFTGRNLGLWTDYAGVDPDTNLTGATNGFGLDYFNNPATQSYLVTLNITY